MQKERSRQPLLGIIVLLGGMALLLAVVLAGGVESLALTATYVSQDGTVTFDYPGHWNVEEMNGVIYVVNDPDVLTNPDGVPNGVMIGIVNSTVATGSYLDETVATAETPLDGVNGLIQWLTEQSPEAKIENPHSFTLDGHAAASTYVSSVERDSMLIVFDAGNKVFFTIAAGSLPGDFAPFESTVMDITQSLQYNADSNEP